MADHSKIEWTDATWNPIRGCSRVSEGCRNCYAERIAGRFSGIGQPYQGFASLVATTKDRGKHLPDVIWQPRWTGVVESVPRTLDHPLHWKRPRKIFVNSMSDLFHESLPDTLIDAVFSMMDRAWWHTFQILTKRPARMLAYLTDKSTARRIEELNPAYGTNREGWCSLPLPHIWLGVSVEDQQTADERIPILLQTPAAVRWVSYEPALGPVDFRHIQHDNIVEIDSLTGDHGVFRPLTGRSGVKIHWVVAGGESGQGARPAHPDWFCAVRDQCHAAGVPFFLKQWGEWLHLSQVPAALTDREREVLRFRGESELENGPVKFLRMGKKRAGYLLDGKAYRQFPVP